MQTAKILSFDPASTRNLGWSIFTIDEDSETGECQGVKCWAGTIVIPEMNEPWQAMWPLFLAVDTIIEEQAPDLVVIEKTSSFAGGFVTGQVSNCIGLILAACGKHECPISFVYPTHVKKVLSGSGKASKAEMKKAVTAAVEKLTGETIKFDSAHSCDAAANVMCWLVENKLINRE